MISDLAEIWRELESSPEAGAASGRRRLHTEGPVSLYATVAARGARGLALIVDTMALAEVGPLDSSRQIDHLRLEGPGPGRGGLELRLIDPGAEDLFSVVASDVASRVAAADTDHQAVDLWTSRVARWQRLLSKTRTGLGPERQRGLYAELHVLLRDLEPRVGIGVAVDGWQGPRGGHDFQLSGGAYEVKSTASHEPQVVIVNSERQLDENGTDGLHLIHVSLDVHQHAGESLPEMVAAVRERVGGTTEEDLFEDKLLDAGYADVHEDRYLATGYTIRERNFFAVGPGFPRIIEVDLPDGVGGVRYSLVIAACSEFSVAGEQAFANLGGSGAR